MTEQLYQTPEGKRDIPFIYVFDGRGLTDGTSPAGLRVPIQENDFLLRSVVGLNTVAQRWTYYNASQAAAIGLGAQAGAGGNNALALTSPRWTVVPEKFYPANSEIKFDLGTVARATNADGNFISLIGFQGVKRVGEGQYGFTQYETQYQYYERPFAYNLPLAINFFDDQGAGERSFEVEVENFDFELQKVAIQETTTGAIGPLLPDPFLIQLFDPTGYMSLSQLPMSPRWLNWFQGGNFFSAFPVPTLVYPIGSRIRIVVNSLIDAGGGTRTFQVSFQGVERAAC